MAMGSRASGPELVCEPAGELGERRLSTKQSDSFELPSAGDRSSGARVVRTMKEVLSGPRVGPVVP